MADKLIGNLITGEHEVPKKGLLLKQKVTRATVAIVIVSLIGFVVWKFINYREERRVTAFLSQLEQGQYEAAFASWDAGRSYKLKDFLEDWGRDGFYTKGSEHLRVATSTGAGGGVIVCVVANEQRARIPILVSKTSLKLSYSPEDKCN